MSIQERLRRAFASRLATNAGWLFIGDAARVALQAAYFVLVARRLGSEEFGVFASVLAMVSILSPFAAWGWGNILIREVSRDRSCFPVLWGQISYVTIVSGALLCALAVGTAAFFFEGTGPVALTAFVAVSELIFFKLVIASSQAYQAVDRLARTASLYLIVSAARFVAALLLVSFTSIDTAVGWAGFYCASSALAAVASLALVTKELGRPVFDRQSSRHDIWEGFHYTVTLSSASAYNDIDKVLLARLDTFAAAGAYSVAYRIVDVVFTPIRSLLFASYSDFFRQGNSGIASGLALAVRLLKPSLSYALVAAGALLIASPFLTAAFGPTFGESSAALRYLAAIPIFRAAQVFASDALTGAGYQRWRSSLQFTIAIVNVALNIVLIPILSWRGAAIASLISDASLMVGIWTLCWLALRRETKRITALDSRNIPDQGNISSVKSGC